MRSDFSLNPLKCKVLNVTPVDSCDCIGGGVATVYAVHAFDHEYIMELMSPARGGRGASRGATGKKKKGINLLEYETTAEPRTVALGGHGSA